jgi:hypothetical protein
VQFVANVAGVGSLSAAFALVNTSYAGKVIVLVDGVRAVQF